MGERLTVLWEEGPKKAVDEQRVVLPGGGLVEPGSLEQPLSSLICDLCKGLLPQFPVLTVKTSLESRHMKYGVEAALCGGRAAVDGMMFLGWTLFLTAWVDTRCLLCCYIDGQWSSPTFWDVFPRPGKHQASSSLCTPG